MMSVQYYIAAALIVTAVFLVAVDGEEKCADDNKELTPEELCKDAAVDGRTGVLTSKDVLVLCNWIRNGEKTNMKFQLECSPDSKVIKKCKVNDLLTKTDFFSAGVTKCLTSFGKTANRKDFFDGPWMNIRMTCLADKAPKISVSAERCPK